MVDSEPPKPSRLQSQLLDIAYSPMKLRVVLAAALLGGWYGFVAMPWSQEIDSMTQQVTRERNRLGLAKQVERLRKQAARFQERIPMQVDPNEWVQYMLSGSRRFGLKLASLDTSARKEVGPYKAVVVRIELEGTFREIDGFIRWVESNQRLLRVDSVNISPVKQGSDSQGQMKAAMVILGVVA